MVEENRFEETEENRFSDIEEEVEEPRHKVKISTIINNLVVFFIVGLMMFGKIGMYIGPLFGLFITFKKPRKKRQYDNENIE